MKNINIKITERYKSIPAGFVWNNIPKFSIITGVNGVGKTQLLEIFGQQGKNGISSNINAVVTYVDGTEAALVLPSPNTKSQNLVGLISYFRDTDNRLNKISQWKRYINNWIERITWIDNRQKESINIEERRQLNQEKADLLNSIKSCKQQINQATIYSYEQELNFISAKCSMSITELSEEDIRKNANPFFNDFSEIEDLESYIKQEHEEYKENLAIAANKKDLEQFGALASQEKPFQIINRLFLKYGFNYFKMLDPFPELKERNGEIRFIGEQGEIVEYQALSSGEKMIVKFIIFSLGRNISGRRINTLILDEPDAHLHPSMCKMMVEILYELSQPKEIGGGDIRVIITTHSPSTVAFAPEGSLFVLEKKNNAERVIKQTTITEAEQILCEGIFTFDKAMSQFTMAANTEKNNLLFVEGKTDVLHLNKAMEILGYDLDVEIIDMHDAGALASFIKSAPHKLFGKKKIIALFDCDDAGKKAFNEVKGNDKVVFGSKMITAEQCEKQSFAMLIQPPAKLEKYCPVEFLYPHDYLEGKGMLIKRQTKEFQFMYKAESNEELIALANELKDGTTLRPFIVDDNKKNWFAETIKAETKKDLFDNFAATLNVIKAIIEYTDEEMFVSACESTI